MPREGRLERPVDRLDLRRGDPGLAGSGQPVPVEPVQRPAGAFSLEAAR